VQRRRNRDGHDDGGHGAHESPLDPPDFASITDGTEVVVPVSVIDKSGTEVVHADITWVELALLEYRFAGLRQSR
jgi:hypothetical protein